MGQYPYLSTVISKARAIATGGGALDQVSDVFDSWLLKNRDQTKLRGIECLRFWAENLFETIHAGKDYGLPVARLLREAGVMVKKEERLWLKLISLEKQYAFQGALAMVLPWGVVAVVGGFRLNFFTVGGAFFQLLGLFLFYFTVKNATKPVSDERVWLRDLMTSVWMRLLSGQSLWAALHASLALMSKFENEMKKTFFMNWKTWFYSVKVAGAANTVSEFEFHEVFFRSRETGALLSSLLLSGAPADTVLEDLIRQLDEEYSIAVDEKISTVPVYLSLIFCFFMTPAVFLILAGALWPMIQNYV